MALYTLNVDNNEESREDTEKVELINQEYGKRQCKHCGQEVTDEHEEDVFVAVGDREWVTECTAHDNPDYDPQAEEGPTSEPFLGHEAVLAPMAWWHAIGLRVNPSNGTVSVYIATEEFGRGVYQMTMDRMPDDFHDAATAGRIVLFPPTADEHSGQPNKLEPHGAGFLLPRQ